MFKLDGSVLVAVSLGESSDDVLRQADEFARSHRKGFHGRHVMPEVVGIRPLFPNRCCS